MNNSEMTQQYSTFGDKLLQHTDVLFSIQNFQKWKPITVQIAPTNVCDLDCSYCSVKNRNRSAFITLEDAKKGLNEFRALGAKAVEITGGGNPLLYKWINELIDYCSKLEFDIGVITNSTNPTKYLTSSSIDKLTWIRVSLSALDINKTYLLHGLSASKLSLSYIINDKTTPEILEQISVLADEYDVKFVRLAPDCLEDDALTINEKWDKILEQINNPKMFIKEIGENYKPFKDGCYVGLIRPYWTPEGIFMCSSHVLKTQKVEQEFYLCDVNGIKQFYESANTRYQRGNAPYCINPSACYNCYYFNNNKLLYTVSHEMKDKNFA